MKAMWVLMTGTILSVVLLLGVVVLMSQFKVWAHRRDLYYSAKLDEYERRIKKIESHFWDEMTNTLKENKELLNKIKEHFNI